MGGLSRVVVLLLAAASAAAAVLIVAPAPSLALGLGAIVAAEKSGWIALAALLAFMVALGQLRFGQGNGLVPGLAAVLAAVALVPALIPIVQANRLAGARGVKLDWMRALRAPIDSAGPGRPNLTVPYTTVPDGRTLSLDVYLPPARAATASRPILVVHGGFWSAGQRGEAPLATQHTPPHRYIAYADGT